MKIIKLELPYPPSVNKIYGRSASGNVYCLPSVLKFRKKVFELVRYSENSENNNFGSSNLSVEMQLFPGSRHKQDIDNPVKSLLDALQYAKLFDDDSQIFELNIKKMGIVNPGIVLISIKEMPC